MTGPRVVLERMRIGWNGEWSHWAPAHGDDADRLAFYLPDEHAFVIVSRGNGLQVQYRLAIPWARHPSAANRTPMEADPVTTNPETRLSVLEGRTDVLEAIDAHVKSGSHGR